MKVVDCVWEIENLGKKTCEVFLKDGEVFDIKNIENRFEYIVVKVPNKNISTIKKLENQGYNFIELQFSLRKKLRGFNHEDKVLKPILNSFYLQKIESEGKLLELLSYMDKKMFDTDRIYLDEKFGGNYSLNRYKNWITSEFKKNSFLYFIEVDSIKIGFILFNEQNKKINALLGGIFSQYKSHGFGANIILGPLKWGKEMEAKEVLTKISSNNFQVLQLYNYFGFEIIDLEYVLVKHINLEEK